MELGRYIRDRGIPRGLHHGTGFRSPGAADSRALVRSGTTASPAARSRLAPEFARAATSQVTVQSDDLREWWTGFNDRVLNSLIQRAVPANMDLRAALLRIDEARAQRAIAAAAYWPTVAVDASFARQRISETTPTGALFNSAANLHLPGGAGLSIPNPYNQFQLSAGASWEIDLFGRIRRAVEAADANVQVSVEDQRGVLVSVLADVAQNYLELRGAQLRLRVSKENLATLNELLDLTRQRRAAGLTTEIDVSNAAAQAYATQASLPPLDGQITQYINQLSKLLGREPEALRAELDGAAAVPTVPPKGVDRSCGRTCAPAARYSRGGGQLARRHRPNWRRRREFVSASDAGGQRRISVRDSGQSAAMGQSVRLDWPDIRFADFRSRPLDGGAFVRRARARSCAQLSTRSAQRLAGR